MNTKKAPSLILLGSMLAGAYGFGLPAYAAGQPLAQDTSQKLQDLVAVTAELQTVQSIFTQEQSLSQQLNNQLEDLKHRVAELETAPTNTQAELQAAYEKLYSYQQEFGVRRDETNLVLTIRTTGNEILQALLDKARILGSSLTVSPRHRNSS